MKQLGLALTIGLLSLSLSSCVRYQLPEAVHTQHYTLASTTDSLPQTAAVERITTLIAPYKSALDGRMNEVIGRTPQAMRKRKPESALGNWIADALQKRAQISVQSVNASIQNYGGIRIPELPAGDITVGKIYELMPFDNQLVIVELSGVMTQRFFDQLAADGGWPVSHEVQFTIQDEQAKRLQIQGAPVDLQAIYHIAMPDYIADGGGDCSFLRELPRQETGLLVRDILVDAVRAATSKGTVVEGSLDGRIIAMDND